MEVSSLWFNTQFTLTRIPHVLRMKGLGRRLVRPAFNINFENQFYQVKTATEPEELIQVLKLRFEVFFQEFSTQKVSFALIPYDIDVHDFICDHLIVKDKSNGKIVACYRLLSTNSQQNFKHFYTESEFNIDEVLKLPGHKMELGRACVHKDYRKGTVIALLWKGLLAYAKASGSRYMFGCSSINRTDFENLNQITEEIRAHDAFIEDMNIGVRPDYKFTFSPEQKVERTNTKAIGSLMYMYMMAGAKLGKEMAYDEEMDCLDMFTLLDLEKMPASFERRFA